MGDPVSSFFGRSVPHKDFWGGGNVRCVSLCLRAFLLLNPTPQPKNAAFLLTIGSFLFTVELFYLQLCLGAFSLTVGAILLASEASLLTMEKCV